MSYRCVQCTAATVQKPELHSASPWSSFSTSWQSHAGLLASHLGFISLRMPLSVQLVIQQHTSISKLSTLVTLVLSTVQEHIDQSSFMFPIATPTNARNLIRSHKILYYSVIHMQSQQQHLCYDITIHRHTGLSPTSYNYTVSCVSCEALFVDLQNLRNLENTLNYSMIHQEVRLCMHVCT